MSVPLNVSITTHREFLPADTPDQKLFVMLKLRPARDVASSRPATSFVLLIDTSGSMYETEGSKTKIDLAMEAIEKLVDSKRFAPDDRIALVEFHDTASELLPLTPARQHQEIKDAIAQLRNFGGGTCMGKGLKIAHSLLASASMSSRRAIVLTDGATFDESVCRALGGEFASSGIPIAALGVGDYNEDLLLHLSDTTGGRVYHVVEKNANGQQIAIEDLPKILIEELALAQQEAINNLALNVRTVRGVQLERATRVYPDRAEFPLKTDPYPLGAARGDDETVFILEFGVDRRASSRVRIAQLGLTYDIPGQNRRGELPPQNLVVQFVTGQGGGAQVDQEVMGYVQQRNISQLVGDATKVAESNPEQAEQLLETARRLTVKIGNQEMLTSLNEGIDELRKTRKISDGTRKTVKMGSRGKTVKMSANVNDELPSEEEIRRLSGT